jgi:hypothetical protein
MSFDWQKLTGGSFKNVPFHVAIPSRDQQYGVESEEMTLERRLQFIKRPLRDGAGVRDWGAEPETFVAVIEFFGVKHHDTAEAFLQVLNEGTPGPLILPTIGKAVLAYFWKRTRATRYQDGNAIRVTVTWVAAAEVQTTGTGQASASTSTLPTVDQAKATLDSDISNALGVLQDNPLLSAVRTFEGGVSKVRSAVNAVLTLEQGVRSRIATLEAEVKGTIALIKGAIAEIHSIFSPSSASNAPTGAGSLGTNSQTGQTVTNFAEPDVIPAPANPLAPPAPVSTVTLPTQDLGSAGGVSNFGDAAAAVVIPRRDELAGISVGRTEDVSRALTQMLNSLAAYVQAVVGQAPLSFTVPMDMSLGEVLFLNGLDQGQLREIHRKNPQVDDPFLVPSGTVVVL